MPDGNTNMTHGRLISRFARLGPYLRQNQSSEDSYFFDCLSVCVDAEKAPDKREFWGWWLELSTTKNGFEYIYAFGKYDKQGKWTKDAVPKDATSEVKKSLDTFYTKLTQFLKDETELHISPNEALEVEKLKL